MLGSLAIGTMIVCEVSLTIYSLNRVGAFDKLKNKAKAFHEKYNNKNLKGNDVVIDVEVKDK